MAIGPPARRPQGTPACQRTNEPSQSMSAYAERWREVEWVEQQGKWNGEVLGTGRKVDQVQEGWDQWQHSRTPSLFCGLIHLHEAGWTCASD